MNMNLRCGSIPFVIIHTLEPLLFEDRYYGSKLYTQYMHPSRPVKSFQQIAFRSGPHLLHYMLNQKPPNEC